MTIQINKTGRGTPRITVENGMKIENIVPKFERTYLPSGSTLGNYRIIEEIDRGGMAVVYKALQLDLDRIVALKVLPANITLNRKFVDRFRAEAHAIAQLSHSNIVHIYEVTSVDNTHFIAMEYIPGKNLFYYLNFEKPKLIDVIEIVAILADALAYAHHQKIVHRDLKLNNVIMKDRLTPMLIDFGLAKALESDEGGITQTGEIMGSPAYMAPERLQGAPTDARSDICSLGIMLYEMLTFKNPYLDPRSLHQTAMNVLEAHPIPPRKLVPWLPPEIEAITLKAMHKEKEQRYQTMEEYRDDLRRYQRGEEVQAQAPSIWTKTVHGVRRHWPWVSLGALLMLSVTVIMLILYGQNRKEQPHWQLVFMDPFDTLHVEDRWYCPPSPDSLSWRVKDGQLVSPGAPSYIRLERPFTRDMRIEFDVRAAQHDLFDAGIFLCGNRPDSGYCVRLFPRGRPGAGIAYPGSGLLFSDLNAIDVPGGRAWHVAVQRRDHAISLSVNDVQTAVVHDFFPPLGEGRQKIGFFAAGAAAFDNLKIFRLAIPQMTSRTLVAERFWERGDFVSALEEYRALQVDFPASELTEDIHLKMSDCMVRMRNFDEARALLDSLIASSRATEVQRAEALYLTGMLFRHSDNYSAAYDAFIKLFMLFPAQPVAHSALETMLMDACAYLDRDMPDMAQQRAQACARACPAQLRTVGLLHCAIMDYYLSKQRWNEAIALGVSIVGRYGHEPAVAVRIQTSMGAAYLGKMDKTKAAEILNQAAFASGTPWVWDAWLGLADVYEYDMKTNDAIKICQKVYRECPRTLPWFWASRVMEAGALPSTLKSDDRQSIVQEIIAGPHPFPGPRLIARYYKGEISSDDFQQAWGRLYPGSGDYRFYQATKTAIDGPALKALADLEKLRKDAGRDAWNTMRIKRLMELAKLQR